VRVGEWANGRMGESLRGVSVIRALKFYSAGHKPKVPSSQADNTSPRALWPPQWVAQWVVGSRSWPAAAVRMSL